jgi:hypothetical protein
MLEKIFLSNEVSFYLCKYFFREFVKNSASIMRLSLQKNVFFITTHPLEMDKPNTTDLESYYFILEVESASLVEKIRRGLWRESSRSKIPNSWFKLLLRLIFEAYTEGSSSPYEWKAYKSVKPNY